MRGEQGGIVVVGRRLARQPADRAVGACNVLVLEYCDGGTLRSAARTGLGWSAPAAAGNGSAAPEFEVQALLDVAFALEHLHNAHVLHGDVKASAPAQSMLPWLGSRSLGPLVA